LDLALVAPLEPARRPDTPPAEEREQDHVHDCRGQMVAESFHRLTPEESAPHSRRLLRWQLDVWATPRAQALLLDREAERSVQERQFDPDAAFGGTPSERRWLTYCSMRVPMRTLLLVRRFVVVVASWHGAATVVARVPRHGSRDPVGDLLRLIVSV